jgi:hypothetical protein
MSGEEIYAKYGLKRDETIVETANFGNSIEMDIKLVICEGEDTPYTEAVLFENGHELYCTDPNDKYTGEWKLECDGEKYAVEIIVSEEEEKLYYG